MMRKELVVSPLNRNALYSDHQQRLKKVNAMNKFLSRAAQALRTAFTADADAKRMLEKTYVEVALNSRFGGN
jgi:hypothetical protein